MAAIKSSDRLYEALVRPFTLAAEPVLLFANVYLAFVCECSIHMTYAQSINLSGGRCRLLPLV
jgi:hypothetical protein